ncbi:UDP-4-amino-4-deoxy-L-arabinose--oxoglutarate aminotransferase [Rubripirellula amarantea]|uniref:UDP-4-amino-4-deoxy-L-arabinose--oxoglutarate aminotransferase n=1 Tax=Rubripirellula amarantea TaxID=2527999 RepID=A0A5C5WS28_9BACT|nr:UDP-4-amino-4,6-dideoxy-N-acetyl-beta-L-altrosamine transaminase [Rubripirellula amarantea]TWT53714.1 UDP-4-amino-4-deoxy-L-arabinose--oxoglutarate aminotransferase [Rubripirellula amarantea]
MIPYGRQSLNEDDIAAVTQVLRGDFLTQGPAIVEFETKLADRCNADHSVACNSGTAALHMAYQSLGIGPGDVVVVPANTFLATANAAVYLGADVRFCDVDPQSGLMTAQTLEPVLDCDVSLVVPVHFAGMACDMKAIAELVRWTSPRAKIVEDASHAIGALHRDGSPVGSLEWSAMATFSFHPVKHIAAGEGGAVTVNDPELLEKLRGFRCHGMTKDPTKLTKPEEGPWYYEMHDLGFNYRIPEASCALASSQMNRLNDFLNRRRAIAEAYLSAWSTCDIIKLPNSEDLHYSAWHLFCLHVGLKNDSLDRADWMSMLQQRGVGSQVHYYPVCDQPYYRNRYGCDKTHFTGAFEHYRTALSVPMYPAMSDAQVQTVIESVLDVASQSKPVVSHAA